jgi:hypothetical protein
LLLWLLEYWAGNASSAHFLVTFILFFDGLGWGPSRPDILSDEEALFIIVGWRGVLLPVRVAHLILFFLGHEPHLLVIWWGEDLLVLCLLSQLWWEDLTLDVAVGLDV